MANDLKPQTADDLGKRIALFGPRKSEGVAGILLGLLFSAGGIALAVFILAAFFVPDKVLSSSAARGPTLWELAAILAIDAIFFAIGIFLALLGRSFLLFREIDFCEDGLLIRKHRKTVRIRWIYIALICTMQVNPSGSKKPITTFTLITKQGERHTIGYQVVKDIDRFGQLLWEYSRKNGIPWDATAG